MSGWRQELRNRFSDRDYLRWRRKRRWIQLLLTIVSLVLLSPIIALYRIFDVRSDLGFVFLGGCVLCLLAIYRVRLN